MMITRFFGDAEYTFALTDPMIAELERIAGLGIGALYLRLVRNEWHLAHLTEIIRLGLIGGGMAPDRAMHLVKTYATDRPLDQVFPLALDVLDARWTGTPDQAPTQEQPA
ncbi:MAG: gene transfer agent family protein [Roseivivax sp.]|nr:gene transfer agent family protein [Roseivivax sp.]